jgi:glycosyltransferase involved in cell wall biosynthesis
MNVSVVLTTYNGEPYIIEQLESIRKQTLKPDEVLIFDDSSTDQTVELIEKFIDEWGLNSWKIHVNDVNVGWKTNFINGFRLASGQFIFPCDQDDIWDDKKIENMIEIMDENPQILLLASNYTPFYSSDEHIKISSKVINSMKYNGSVDKYEFAHNFLYVARPGCSFCLRKDLFGYANKLWFEGLAHDALLWRSAMILDGLFIYNKSTMRYRRHGENATNLKTKNISYKFDELMKFIRIVQDFQKEVLHNKNIIDKEQKLNIINECEKFLFLKKKLYETENIFLLLPLFFKYKKYYISWKSILGELYLLLDKRKQGWF